MFDSFYRLEGQPFQLTPDPSFYFLSASHRKALSYIDFGLSQGEGFVVVSGEVGAGKSILAAFLKSKTDPAELTIGQIATARMEAGDVAANVAQAFGIETGGLEKMERLRALANFLRGEAEADRHCLLIVDEAQQLSVEALEELRSLVNMQSGSQALMQCLLLGQPELRATLEDAQELEPLRQRVIAMHHLEAMHEGEVEAYVKHRLKRVGWNGSPEFDQRLFNDLFRASGGIPRKVNQIANRLLLLGAVDKRVRIDCAMLGAVLDEIASDLAVLPSSRSHLARKPNGRIDELLAQRDNQIADLQKALQNLSAQRVNLAAVSEGTESGPVRSRIVELEGQLAEQERTIRHTLTMLIEWIEGEFDQPAAA